MYLSVLQMIEASEIYTLRRVNQVILKPLSTMLVIGQYGLPKSY